MEVGFYAALQVCRTRWLDAAESGGEEPHSFGMSQQWRDRSGSVRIEYGNLNGVPIAQRDVCEGLRDSERGRTLVVARRTSHRRAAVDEDV